MILYLDTSSLIKLYVEEEGSAEVRRQLDEAEVVATSVVALPEARSALARLAREAVISPSELVRARRALLRDWQVILKVRVLVRVYERAGDLAETHALRGFDALHLASYLELVEQAQETPVVLSSFDGRQNAAAEVEQTSRRGPHTPK